MRLDGTLKTWDDERGYGFIAPSDGSEDIFVHIKAIPLYGARPAVGMVMSFEIEAGAKGKKRAAKVELAPEDRPVRPGKEGSPQPMSYPALAAIPLFVLLYAVIANVRPAPGVVAVYYAGASGVCFLAYAVDKLAAVRQSWRTSEGTLLILGLVGGWPGGLLAQYLLRHKSSKPSFRIAFWWTVVLNVVGFLVIVFKVGQ
ncbi:MAG TPA: cold shock and DUF1294 domain-containing protein [Fimbriimonadaceae bacterium]|mgnify:CR=1 FL=1|nr:cold shock and DUF1294 domain-containing protein [Fimbriimonadaceae bacterium]